MKHLPLLLSIVVLFASCGTALQITDANREFNNFTCESNSVYWSYVYPMASADSAAVRDWFNASFSITKDSPKSIIGESNKNSLPYSESGLDRMSMIMLFQHPCVVYFKADFKENRYRVIVDRIIWYPQVGVTTYGVTQGVGTMDLNEIALKKGGLSSVFYNTSSEQLNTMLTYMFTARLRQAASDDNW